MYIDALSRGKGLLSSNSCRQIVTHFQQQVTPDSPPSPSFNARERVDSVESDTGNNGIWQ
ncbi:unnamed protein product, partial [Ceratitis capitata]